jgi:hypothetical protein
MMWSLSAYERRTGFIEPMFTVPTRLLVAAALVSVACFAAADPIKQVQGVIAEVGEGFLFLKPDGDTQSRKFLLRWKARFVPPKLPLKGDRVLILYKEKEEGLVVYGLNYFDVSPESLGKLRGLPPDAAPTDGELE